LFPTGYHPPPGKNPQGRADSALRYTTYRALNTPSWDAAVSNVKLLAFLISQNGSQRHNFFQLSTAQSFYLASFT
jgi:hypothetical protein